MRGYGFVYYTIFYEGVGAVCAEIEKVSPITMDGVVYFVEPTNNMKKAVQAEVEGAYCSTSPVDLRSPRDSVGTSESGSVSVRQHASLSLSMIWIAYPLTQLSTPLRTYPAPPLTPPWRCMACLASLQLMIFICFLVRKHNLFAHLIDKTMNRNC